MRIYLILLFLWVHYFSCSQSLVKDSVTVKPSPRIFKKYEIVFNPLTSVKRSDYSSGILVRINHKKISLRWRAELGNREKPVGDSARYQKAYLSSSLGVQKNIVLSKIGEFYWGADLSYLYNYESTSEVYRNYSNSIGISPLAGFRFCIKKILVFGAENSGFFSLKNSHYKNYISDKILNYTIYDFDALQTRFFIGFTF